MNQIPEKDKIFSKLYSDLDATKMETERIYSKILDGFAEIKEKLREMEALINKWLTTKKPTSYFPK